MLPQLNLFLFPFSVSSFCLFLHCRLYHWTKILIPDQVLNLIPLCWREQESIRFRFLLRQREQEIDAGFVDEMTSRPVNSRHALEACTLQLHAWKPFQIQALPVDLPNPNSLPSKKPCRSDRSTAPSLTADGVEFFRLSLLDDPSHPKPREERGFRWLVPRKRRRRGSRSVSGRSSDRSGRRRRGGCGGASAANATCSDFPPVTYGTDSSGELFLNGDGSWGSDVSEARVLRREGGVGEGSSFGSYPGGGLDSQGNESGYGSETGYRGDAEFGYGDEVDEEDEDGKHLFWGGRFVAESKRMEIVGENNFAEQKAHHRCRRRKSDWRVFAPPR